MNWVPVVVNSRAELELLRERPMQLQAVRNSWGPRAGHPDFIGPLRFGFLGLPGAIRFEGDGAPFFELAPPKPQPLKALRGRQLRLWDAGGGVERST